MKKVEKELKTGQLKGLWKFAVLISRLIMMGEGRGLRILDKTKVDGVSLRKISAFEADNYPSVTPISETSDCQLYSVPVDPTEPVQRVRFQNGAGESISLKCLRNGYLSDKFLITLVMQPDNYYKWVLLRRIQPNPPTFRLAQDGENLPKKTTIIYFYRIKTEEVGKNLEDRLLIICFGGFQLYRFKSAEGRVQSYQERGYFSHKSEKLLVKYPIFHKSEYGLFIIAADGYPYQKGDPESNFRLGTYKINFKDSGDAYEEIESIDYTPGSGKNRTNILKIENHGIKYNLENSREENLYSSHFFYGPSCTFA